jgi:hypothetical protein
LDLSATTPLSHQAYVWQRTWDGRVQQAVTTHGTNFERLIVLAAEVAWNRTLPEIVRPELDYAALRAAGRPVGLALRIGNYSGNFSEDFGDPVTRGLTDLAVLLIRIAASNQVNIAEFQVDFDCAESNLAGYQRWLTAFRRRLAPMPVTITALPAWLHRREFRALVGAIDGYVLQVHSFERPRDIGSSAEICPPADARRWVSRASALGGPFRVALPTYGYRISYDAAGRYLGISAEGPEKKFPGAKMERGLRAQPAAMAELVQEWSKDRPTGLIGVLWYRLPVRGDNLNWSWRTLSEVIAGRPPHTAITIGYQQRQPGLFELHLMNDGTADYHGTPIVRARWNGPRWIAGDGLAGFQVTGPFRHGLDLENVVELTPARPIRLPAGETRWIGWLRLQSPLALAKGHEPDAAMPAMPGDAIQVELR